MSDLIPVNLLTSYTPTGTTLADVARVVGERTKLTQEEAALAIARCEEIVKARRVIRNHCRSIMLCSDAPHNRFKDEEEYQAIEHYAYVGQRVGKNLHLKAIQLSLTPVSLTDAMIPSCVINDRGFLVYHIQRTDTNSWACRLHDGSVTLYGDLYRALSNFTVEIP